MPELPEVETICKELSKNVLNLKIITIQAIKTSTVISNDHVIDNHIILDVVRRAKYIIFQLSNEMNLIVHLRMTGKLIFPSHRTQKNKYTRAIIELENDQAILFDDVRTFGKIVICTNNEKELILNKLGVEPFSDDFNITYLRCIAKSKNISIKDFLLNQVIVAGLGNIYVQEILFYVRISPIRKCKLVKKQEWEKIIIETRRLLTEAIKHNGTSISDFRRIDDKTGEFQNFLQVYGKKNCPICKEELEIVKQSGRTTRYCKVCQK